MRKINKRPINFLEHMQEEISEMSSLKTILLIEDQNSFVDLFREALEEIPNTCSLHWVNTGEQAFAYLDQILLQGKALLPSLMIIDLNLPGMNGLEIVQVLKSSPIFSHIPVLIFSTSCNDRDIRNCYAFGANCFITKPRDVKQFFSVVQAILDFWLRVAILPNKYL